MKTKVQYLFLLFSILIGMNVEAQDGNFFLQKISSFSTNAYQQSVGKKLKSFDDGLDKAVAKFQRKFKRSNKKLRRQLGPAADSLLNDVDIVDSSQSTASAKSVYVPYLDTLGNTLSFLQSVPGIDKSQLANNTALLESAKNKLASIDKMKALMNDRQRLLQQLGEKYKQKAVDYFRSVSKEFYYFNETVNNYKQLLTDPSRIEEKLLAILRELPAFQQFLQRNSAIAGLFRIPSGDPGSLQGLQTRNMIQALLVEKTSFSSFDARGMVAGQLQSAKSKMDELKQQLNGDNGSAGDLPDFKPNNQKTKTFLQRVELGSNLKFSGKNNSLPVRSELMLSAGYKFSDKISLGVGFTHWLGLGEGLQKIAFSHEGVGFNSYYRMALKGSFFMSGGWEQNYFSSFRRFGDIRDQDGWKSSALLGIGKKTSLGKSFLKGKWGKGRTRSSNITLLYDFLYKQSQPQTEALKLRFGFTF